MAAPGLQPWSARSGPRCVQDPPLEQSQVHAHARTGLPDRTPASPVTPSEQASTFILRILKRRSGIQQSLGFIVAQYAIVIPSKHLLRSEGSGRAGAHASRSLRGKLSHAWRASLNGKLSHYPWLAIETLCRFAICRFTSALTFPQGTGETSGSPRGCFPAARTKPGLAEL